MYRPRSLALGCVGALDVAICQTDQKTRVSCTWLMQQVHLNAIAILSLRVLFPPDLRTQQQAAASHLLETLEFSPASAEPLSRHGQRFVHSSYFTEWYCGQVSVCVSLFRLPFSFINKEVSKATCLCLLEEASHAQMVGRCHAQVC